MKREPELEFELEIIKKRKVKKQNKKTTSFNHSR